MNLRFNHISEPIKIFLDVKHRQRHRTSDPYRRLRKIESRTCIKKEQQRDKMDQLSQSFGEAEGGSRKAPGGSKDETKTLTDPPTIPKGCLTRIRLRMISQEPVGIEFQRVCVSIRVVQNLPIHQVRSPGAGTDRKKDIDKGVSPLTRCLGSPSFPWE